MKDDAERVTLAGAQAADAVAHRHPIRAAGAFDRPMMDRKDYRFALSQRHDLTARLRPRALLDQQKLATAKVDLGCAEQHGQLQRKYQGAVQILVQTIVVANFVFE